MNAYLYPSSIFFERKNFWTLAFLLLSFSLFGQLNVETNKTSATYQVGEYMTFNVSSNFSTQVTWTLKYDNTAPTISTGSFFISAGQTKTIPYTASEPGLVLCQVSNGGNAALASAAFAPFDIDPFTQEPSDFDAFWNSQKAALSGVSINPQVTFFQNGTYSKTYRVRLNNIDGRKVYGYLTVPNGSGPFPAIVVLPPYGNSPNLSTPEVDLAEKGGVLVLSVSIHNAPPDQTDPNAYEPDNYADKNQNYYRYGILGAVQAINYLFTRNDFDGNNLGMMGVSQGAGLATILAGLDSRVKLLAFSNPVLSQNGGLSFDRAGGFPNFVQQSRNGFGTASHESATVSATRYYDAMFFARRYKGPTLAALGYEDVVTPAATGFTTFNQLRGPKILCHGTDLGHSHPFEYWLGRFDFLRRFFPATQNTTPFPFGSNDLGYDIDAGQNTSTSSSSVNLNGSIKKNNTNNPNFQLKWEKVSGPGNVSFGSSGNYNTTATFSSSGTYVLQFSGKDEALLNSQSKFFTLFDYVTVNVGSGGGGNTDNTSPSVSLSTSSTNVSSSFTVNVNFSENVNGLSSSDFNVSNGNVSNLNGSGSFYQITVNPSSSGQINISLPAFRVNDAAGNSNTTSNTLSINYSSNTGGGGGSGGCNNPVNLALNKSTSQHSTQFGASASRAVDGNTNGDFWNGNSTTLTNYAQSPWWQVDLGSVSEIDEIRIWNRTECCSNALSNYQVLVSNNPFSSTDLNTVLNQSGVSNFYQGSQAGTPSTISINSTGRYVRIQLVGANMLAIAEVQVMGCSGSSSTIPNQQNQNISFSNISNKTTTDSPFQLNASASSGLPVSFQVLSGPAFLSGNNTLNLNGNTGTVTVRASQAGNSTYNAATSVTRNFIVSQPSGGGGSGNGGCSGSENLALGKSASQHSTQFGASASRAVDGNTNGNFWNENSTSLTNWTSNAWWQVDLGAIGDIDEVKIWNRTDCCSDKLKDYYVFVSDTPFNSNELNNTLAQNGVSSFLQNNTAGRPTTININRTGRYVRIQRNGNSFLALSEVEVMGCFSGGSGNPNPPTGGTCMTTTNVAQGKPAQQSSTLSVSGITGSATKAVDGNTNGTFFISPAQNSSVAATQTESQPYWQVDLQNNYFIEEIKVYNRTDGVDKTRDAYVLVSDQPFTSSNLSTARSQADYEFFISGSVGSPTTVTPEITGRYVRVQMQGSGYLVLGEVEVMGCASSNFISNSNTLIALPGSDFLFFDGKKENRKVELSWITNMEQMNDYFILERSQNGIDFEFLREINSHTNSHSTVSYSELDDNPFYGKNYYRLVQTLTDGTIYYSNIYEVEFDINLNSFVIFPNPAQHQINVNLKEFSGQKALIQIYDARGILVKEKRIDAALEYPEQIDLKELVNGLYIITVKLDSQRLITKQFSIKKLY